MLNCFELPAKGKMKFIYRWLFWTLLFLKCSAHTSSCRNATSWPFASTSIWNTPIGSDARFHDPGLFRPPFSLPDDFFSDDDYFIVTSENDPPTPWYNQGWWTPESHCDIKGKLVGNIAFPANLTITKGGNNAAAILQPDNRTIINTQPIYRCEPGSPVLSLLLTGATGKDDIVSGNGSWGAHGGSGLSSIGGTIRLGELLSNAPPIQHALKLQLYAFDYYYEQPPGFVWPALYCDGYAFDKNFTKHYGGKDIYVSPGALLAIPFNITVNVTTVPGQKMLFALRNYGGYLCDDTYYNRGTVNTEYGVTDEFQVAYGYRFNSGPTGPGAAWYADMLTLFQSLRVVINNSKDTIGGEGTPLQPPPPPICPIETK